MMSTLKETSSNYLRIPSWDGKPRTWATFKRDFDWYLHSVKVTERRYIVARVKPYLTGEAKTFSTRWRARDFDHVNGPELFIRRLSESGLVRRPLKDANVSFDRYFSFERRSGEATQSVLVRENLLYEEFIEPVDRLLETPGPNISQGLGGPGSRETKRSSSESDAGSQFSNNSRQPAQHVDAHAEPRRQWANRN